VFRDHDECSRKHPYGDVGNNACNALRLECRACWGWHRSSAGHPDVRYGIAIDNGELDLHG
jgi:hypothetical protein